MDAQNMPGPPIVWDEARTVKLIKAYQAQDVLWNVQNRGFVHRNARHIAWKTMASVLETSISDVKRKMNSLIAVYRWQHRKGVANPRWWSSHMAFLMNPPKADAQSQLKLGTNSSTCDYSENSDVSISNESDNEFIAVNPRKRVYQSAFQEFRAEFEKPVISVEESNSNTKNLVPHCDEHLRRVEIAITPERSPDSFDGEDLPLYMKYLECKLKKYPSYTRNAIQFQFNRILYEADMGLHDKPDVQKLA